MSAARAKVRWLALGASMAATLDITYAVVFYHFRNNAPPERIFQSIATGLLGKASFQGGAQTAALGLCLHFLIATTITLVFYVLAQRIPFLTSHFIVGGILYGVGVYVVMNYVVIPLSAIHRFLPFDPLVAGTGILVHMFFIGVPIAWSARKALGRDRSS